MRYIIGTLALILFFALVAGVKAAQIKTLIMAKRGADAAGGPVEVVSSVPVREERWENTIKATGNVSSGKGVALSNDMPGIVTRINFESGARVKAGTPLVELDTRVERAQLSSLEAKLRLASRALERSRSLVAADAISRSALDADEASFDGLTADVEALKAQIAHKTIRAPFTGRLGIRAVNLGEYLPPGSHVGTLESEEPLYIDFTLPQEETERVRVGLGMRALGDAGGRVLAEGVITALDPVLDAGARALRARASVQKPAAALRPGMFVDVRVVLPSTERVLVIPETAVLHAPYGDSVFTVVAGADGVPRARRKLVRVGETRGDFAVLLDGLAPNEQVVSAGAFKLRNGAPLRVDNRGGEAASLDPTPVNR